MLNHKSNLPLQEIDVLPKKISVPMIDDPRNKVEVVLPAVQEINQQEETSQPDLYVSYSTNDFPVRTQPEFYENEYAKLSKKHERFGSSYTYLSHLAQLRQLVGDLDGAERHLREALRTNQTSFLRVDLSALLIEKNDYQSALQILHQGDISNDLQTNLRLAHISVRQEQIEDAERYVNQALLVDNTNYEAQLFSGAIHLYKMEWAQAVRSFRVAAETKDDSSVLCTNLAAAYWRLGEEEKAVKSLRKAVFLDPLNETAVLFLADVMFSLGTPEKCIAPLEAILSYNQDNPEIWARAARAYYESGTKGLKDKSRLQKSLDALKIQLKVQGPLHSEILNNLGVVQNELGNASHSRRYFERAWIKAKQLNENEDIPFLNLLNVLVQLKQYKEVIRLSKVHLKSRGDDALPSIFVYYIDSMGATGKSGQAAIEAERILQLNIADDTVNVELLSHLFCYKAHIEPDPVSITGFMRMLEEIFDRNQGIPQNLRRRALNNMVFALLRIGDINRAKHFLGILGQWVHRDSCATATLGLYHLKMGRVDRAKALYKESIELEADSVSKIRIRQRMNIELGRFYLDQGDNRRGVRHLKQAINKTGGYDYAVEEGRGLLRSLTRADNSSKQI